MSAADAESDQITIRGVLPIRDGQRDAAVAAYQALRAESVGREGIVFYRFFLNGAGTEFISLEVYASSQVLLDHMANEHFDDLYSTIDVSVVDAFGPVTPELREALDAGGSVNYFDYVPVQ
jgi:quinol monooxygenase YgiN